MVKSQKRSILIIDDEMAIRQMLRMTLEIAGFYVMEAHDVATAKRGLSLALPNLILLDWMLPSVTGISFARILKKDRLTRDIPIIMLTAKATEENKVLALESGADDYVVKPFSSRELLARIEAVLRRGPLKQIDGSIEVANLIVDTNLQSVSYEGEAIKLGPLEYRLLVFFMTHVNRVYTRDELLSYVWGVSAYLDQRTVDVHVRRLRKRLAPYGCDQLVQTVHGSGYVFSEKKHGRK